MKANINPGDVFDIQDDEDILKLRKHLIIKAPEDIPNRDEFSFTRTREVEIPWGKHVGASDSTKRYILGVGSEHIRNYFEKLWGIEYRADGSLNLDTLLVLRDQVRASGNETRFAIGGGGALAPDDTQSFYFIAHPDGPYFSPDPKNNFTSTENYLAFWGGVHKVVLELDLLTQLGTLDLTPGVLSKQYTRIKAVSAISSDLESKADELVASASSGITSPNELSNVIAAYQRMKSPAIENSEALSLLQDRANSLGYRIDFPNQGAIVKVNEARYMWLATYTKIENGLTAIVPNGRGDSVIFSRDEETYGRETSQDQVVNSKEIIADKIKSLESSGYKSYVFQLGQNTLVDQNGDSIRAILKRCVESITFWQNCAVWLPVFNQGPNGDLFVSEYTIVTAPVLGATPITLPKVYIEENVTVRSRGETSEVGDLAHILNLAPGEERVVSIESRSTRELELQQSATSLLDISLESKFENSSDFESELRRTAEKSGSNNWNASVSGSYFGFVSGSAGGGASSSYTNSDFQKRIQKVLRNAASNNTRNTRREVSSSNTVKLSTSRRDSLDVTMRNVNEGRTLNLAFYNVYNKKDLGVYLESLSFVVDTGIEIIEGSGITEFIRLDLADIQNVLLFADLYESNDKEHSNRYPIVKRVQNGHVVLHKTIVDAIVDTLLEYDTSNADSSSTITVTDLEDVKGEPNLSKKISMLSAGLSNITYHTDRNIGEREKLIVGTAGLYVDSFVGSRTATEPYIEWMRLTEIQTRESEIELNLAKARKINAFSVPGISNQIKYSVDGCAKTLRILFLKFNLQVPEGVWDIIIDGEKMPQSVTVLVGTLEYEVDFGADQEWLSADELNYGLLVHGELRIDIPFIV